MSQPTPTVFYIAIFREDQAGPQHKVLTSVGGLLRFCESVEEAKARDFDQGPFDAFAVDVEELEVVKYDLRPLLQLARPKKKKGEPR
jgi:hypothetical protein